MAVVKPEVGEVAHRPGFGQWPALVVADRQRDAALPQELPNRGCEPACVSELEAVVGAGQLVERRREQVVVAPEALRQLPENRPKPSPPAQWLKRLPKARDRVGDLAQT